MRIATWNVIRAEEEAGLAHLYLTDRRAFDRHRRLARVTLPIWLYVSVSGVLVYVRAEVRADRIHCGPHRVNPKDDNVPQSAVIRPVAPSVGAGRLGMPVQGKYLHYPIPDGLAL